HPPGSHTGAAQGGVCAALGNQEEDRWEWHVFDTVKGGDYLVDQDAAEILAREAIETVIELEHMGMPFNRTPDGRIDQRRFGGHTRNHGEAPRGRGRWAAGLAAYRTADGELVVLPAKTVLLATGGFGRLFRITSNAWSLTGDGIALAYRHGLPLEDMEFYQFHPTGLAGLGIL